MSLVAPTWRAYDAPSLVDLQRSGPVSQSTEEFVYRTNVRNYTRQLAETSEELQRKRLMILLAEEHARAIAKGWMPLLN
jgi:hypothetical protein